MFREMRRKRQQLPREEAEAVLRRGSFGVLAVHGEDGYPYAVPLSYVYWNGKIYFHCAREGHKLDAIRRDGKVSFCVVDRDDVKPLEYTTYFCSAVVFGRARVLEDEGERRRALDALSARYTPGHEEERKREMESQLSRLEMVEITVEHITGKEAKELVKEREAHTSGEKADA